MQKLQLLLLVVILISQAKGLYRVMTAGYSNTSYSYSFNKGHLDELLVFGIDKNMSFMQYDADMSTLYAVHMVDSYEDWQDIGVVSRNGSIL